LVEKPGRADGVGCVNEEHPTRMACRRHGTAAAVVAGVVSVVDSIGAGEVGGGDGTVRTVAGCVKGRSVDVVTVIGTLVPVLVGVALVDLGPITASSTANTTTTAPAVLNAMI
jgi:hypothetical protein